MSSASGGGGGGASPQTRQCIYFRTLHAHLVLTLEKIWRLSFVVDVNLLSLNLLIFKVDNNIIWNAQNAPDRTIFIIFFGGGGHPPGPPPDPSTSVNTHCYRATNVPAL